MWAGGGDDTGERPRLATGYLRQTDLHPLIAAVLADKREKTKK